MSTICMHVCLVAWLCLTLCDPMNCGPPGSSVHGDSPGKNTGVACHALLQGIFPTQGSNPGLLHCRRILYHLRHQGTPRILEQAAYPISRGTSWPSWAKQKKSSLYNIVISIISFRIFSNLCKLHYVFKYMGRDWENICQIIDIIYHPSKGLKERIVFYILCFSCCLGFTTINTNFYLFKIDCQKQSFFFHCGKIFVLVYICL